MLHVVLENVYRLEKRASRNFMQFNKGKCKILHLGKNDPRCQDMLESRKDPGGPGERQVEHEAAVCPCGKGGEWYLGLH